MDFSLGYVEPMDTFRPLPDLNQNYNHAGPADGCDSHSTTAQLQNTHHDVVAIFGTDGFACAATAVACNDLALNPKIGPEAWSYGGLCGRSVSALVLVHGNVVDGALIRLVQTCRSLGARRLVLIGPPFGSLGAEQALVHGFDEVWPAGMARRLCVALVRKAWQTASQMSEAESVSTLRFGRLSLGKSQSHCTYQHREIYLGRDSLSLLRVLIAHYPQPVSRQSVLEAMGKMDKDFTSDTRVVDMAVTRLRQRLQAAKLHDVVVSTVRGVGYCVGSA